MKTAYIVRYGAYGDHVHMSNVIKALDELGYHITFEYNHKGLQLHPDNPRVDRHVPFEPSRLKKDPDKLAFWKRHDVLKKEYDLYVNFSGSLETALISPEEYPEYFWPLHLRRAKNANICYYDQSMIWAGLTDRKYMGWTGEIFHRKEDHEFIKNWLAPYKDKFMILWGMRGTMWQKAVYPIAKDICDEFLKRHPNSIIITTGDNYCKQWEWDHPKVVHKSGRMPFRQAFLVSRYVDMVVTPETGLGIAAGMYGTPKIMLLTAASLRNVVGNDINDYSLQSDAWCSPCTRAIYNMDNCPTMEFYSFKVQGEKIKLPICINFKKERVLQRMEEIVEARVPRKWDSPKEEVYV